MSHLFTYPYLIDPPASPFLGPASSGGWVYERFQTGVRAEIAGGLLSTPVPRASFHALELAAAFHLDEDFALAHRAASAKVASDAPLLRRALGLAYWRYTVSRHDLRMAWQTAEILIPDLLLLAHRERGTTTTVVVWSDDARALALPDAAEAVIVRPAFTLAGVQASASALLPAATVRAAMGEKASAHDAPVPHILYRGGAAHGHIIESLRRAPGEPVRAYRAVRPDAVVDDPD